MKSFLSALAIVVILALAGKLTHCVAVEGTHMFEQMELAYGP